VIQLDAPSVLLQWASGGLFFLWLTTRRREVGIGYGWLLRSVFGLLALGGFAAGLRFEWVPARDLSALAVAVAAGIALVTSFVRRRAGLEGPGSFDPRLDAVAPAIGAVGLIAAGLNAGDPPWLSVARMVVGAAFLGAVTDAMLLGHWYLVQPGLRRDPLIELVKWTGVVWLPSIRPSTQASPVFSWARAFDFLVMPRARRVAAP